MPGTEDTIRYKPDKHKIAGERQVREKIYKPKMLEPQFYYKPEYGDFFDWLENWQVTHNVNILTKETTNPEPIPKTGVMNPFVLARLLCKPTRMHLTRKKAYFQIAGDDLIEAVQTYDKTCTVSTYKDIFDPRKSPLFKPFIKDAIKMTYGSIYAPMVASMPATGTQVKGRMANFNYPVKALATGIALSSPCDLVGAGENPDVPYDHADKYGVAYQDLRPGLPGTPPLENLSCPMLSRPSKNRSELSNDPMQGICRDCYFLAALYSTALKYYNVFPPTLTPVGGIYSISFYRHADLSKKTQTVKSTYPLTNTGHMVFTQQTPEFELWSALYEKAYAKFCGLPQSTLPNNQAGDPEIGSFNQGDPMTSLTHLTKLKYDESANNSAGHPSLYRLPLTHPADYGATSYNTLLTYDSVTCTNPSHHISLYPTVAWIAGVRGNNANYYGNPAIVQQHAYSVLGLYKGYDDTNTLKNYIVLRNPWANKIDRTAANLSAVKPYLAKGTWTSPEAAFSVTFGNKADGIFGLESSAFDNWFAGFGWVQFTKAQIYN